MKFESVQHAARAYLERGFRIIPMHGVDEHGWCTCGGWLPTGKPCNAGKHEVAELDGLWKDGHRFGEDDLRDGMNLAIALGPWRPGRWLVCLDVDGAEDLRPFFQLEPPPTLTQASPRGMHYFFTVPEFAPLGNWIDTFSTRRGGFALDIRYARGKVNVAPSRSPHGEYRWVDWRSPAPLPTHFLDAILSVRRERGLPVAESWDRGEKRP